MSFEKYAAIIGLIATIPVYKGWFLILWKWNKARKITYLEKQLEVIGKLHEDNKCLIIYIGQSLLTVLAFIAASQIYQFMNISTENSNIAYGFISFLSLVTYLIAIRFLGKLTQVRDYEKYSGKLKLSIERLKS
ncbi:hypothetical protein LZP73_00440 [Shewanella sp. AS16]|uniref:hypothetical protein n=1 Tax=Shewanella sp. AS16 TaxID=2907625 RepID=UPI001F215AE8|nr:hypothetical protein [Shewanella sp. AS16]MCE9684688.1 hypothetical protein [Shewanella sp. AS16]